MAVAFPFGQVGIDGGSGSLSLTVTKGQPILLFQFFGSTPTITDTFATHYTWTQVGAISYAGPNGTAYHYLYIGTGGWGASGTIQSTGGGWCAAWGASGASVLSGLSAIDQSGNSSGSSTTPSTPSLTPSASNEGAVFSIMAVDFVDGAWMQQGPGGGWTALNVQADTVDMGFLCATSSSPTSGVGLSVPSLQISSAGGVPDYLSFGAILKAFVATAPSAPTVGAVSSPIDIYALGATISCTYNATDNVAQNAYAVRIKQDSGSYQYLNVALGTLSSTIVWNTDANNTAPSGSFNVVIPAGLLTDWHTYHYSVASQESGANDQGAFATDQSFYAEPAVNGGLVATMTGATTAIAKIPTSGNNLAASMSGNIETSGGLAPTAIVPWLLPVSIDDHPYQMDFDKSQITTMQVRRQSADDSVEPGEQTLSAGGVWPRAQDNYFLGAGQEFLDNRFAFESVYVHSGEYPSVRTRFWKSQGVNPWSEGKMTLLPEYASIATSSANLLIVACGNYLYKTDGAHLYWTLNPVGTASPSWTQVTTSNTNNIVSLTSDGSRVWFACASQGVFVTSAGSTTVAAAATPTGLNGIGGLLAYAAGAGNTNTTNLPNSSTTWYVSEVDAFGNETAAVSVTATPTGTPINLTWNPDTNATNFNVRRNIGGSDLLIYTGDTPSFVDDGTVAGSVSAHPTSNATGSTAYAATWILYSKTHLLASTGRDLVEILANGDISFIYQHENPNFVFVAGCELPSAIIVAGNAGSLAFIGAIQPDSSNNGATLAPPTWASALPYGETINALAYNAGSILLGTSLGVRTGTDANSNGIFDINPVIEDPGSVLCTAAWAQYQYFGWSNYNPSENWATRSTLAGLGRADLSQYTTSGVAAYASDVMGASAGTTTQVVVISGVPYFVVDNAGAYTLYGPDNKVVASGWFEPGWIRYGTLENKILVEVDFQHEPLPSGAGVDYKIVYENTETVVDIVSNFVAGSTTIDEPENAGLAVGDRFMPIITLTAATGQASGPVFLSHITKAMVTTKRQDEILLALVWAERFNGLGPAQQEMYMNCWTEYVYLKGLEGTGQVVVLTMGGTVRSAFIDQVQLRPSGITDDRQWLTGSVTVKLITLSPIS